MDNDVAVKVENLHKDFVLPQHKNTSIKQTVVNITRKNGKVTQSVLDGISFEVKKGDFFGIVGRNGSGKSTLLKILAGVYSPTSGSVAMNGNLTPFIELGVGFNPELSGRDNVFLNGALLGFTHKQMADMYDEIVEFAELEQFMDQKLKNYSSGMQVRLAFSIAIKAKNEILIFDEVLAVGDEAFQRKCLDVFEQYKSEGQTVILVTHDMETVRKFCTRALVLDKGKILKIGHPHQVAAVYSELNLEQIEKEMLSKGLKGSTNSLGLKLEYRNAQNKKTSRFKCGDKIRIITKYNKSPNYQHLVINIYKQSGEHLTGFRIPGESGNAEVEITALFSKGMYHTLVQAVNNEDAAVGNVIIGQNFMITTNYAPGMPGWSGLVPIDYLILES
jgi:ABC-type polysaccharide/polyol phosphate transport system ATPase subunit